MNLSLRKIIVNRVKIIKRKLGWYRAFALLGLPSFLLVVIMNLNDLWWFLGTFLTVYLLYFFYQVVRVKKFNPDKVPVELLFLIKKYHLDMQKVKYQKIMNLIALISAFDIAFTAVFVMKYIKNIYLAIIIGAIIFIPLILITYNFLGVYCIKKGMTINGNKKN